MRTTRLRQAGVLLTAAAVLATMTAATVAAPVSAARPKCAGKVATHVGTRRGEVIRGSRRADVIVARGGNDRIYGRGGNDIICGGSGHDRIVGGPGHDRLLGGPGNDSLNGGTGNDACFQGGGSGSWLNCERPVPTLVIAYSDVNNNHTYDAGDVMISKIIDTHKSGTVSPGDTIKMGKYPTSPAVITLAGVRKAFEDWRVKSHTVTSVAAPEANVVEVTSSSGTHKWSRYSDFYYENNGGGTSYVWDPSVSGGIDEVIMKPGSPSQPTSSLNGSGLGNGDDGFIDVEIYP
jgi:Ca2+-binding RTX toxin-like protein